MPPPGAFARTLTVCVPVRSVTVYWKLAVGGVVTFAAGLTPTKPAEPNVLQISMWPIVPPVIAEGSPSRLKYAVPPLASGVGNSTVPSFASAEMLANAVFGPS